MIDDPLGYLLSQPDSGADDSLQEHLSLREEMARRAEARADAAALASFEVADLYLAPLHDLGHYSH